MRINEDSRGRAGGSMKISSRSDKFYALSKRAFKKHIYGNLSFVSTFNWHVSHNRGLSLWHLL